MDSNGPEVHLNFSTHYPSQGISTLGWDDKGVASSNVAEAMVPRPNAWNHCAIVFDGLHQLSFWCDGALLHQFSDCATMSCCDSLRFICSQGAYTIREVGVLRGAAYSAPWTFDLDGRWNALLHEAQSGTINM